MRLFVLVFTMLAAVGCRATGSAKYVVDIDEDGFGEGEDCDDNDPTSGAPTTWYADGDADGHGDGDAGDGFCDPPEGYSRVGDDCDDADSTSYPGAPELCDDLDNDCDGVVDNGVPLSSWYADSDGDGYGDPATAIEACAAPLGSVADGAGVRTGDHRRRCGEHLGRGYGGHLRRGQLVDRPQRHRRRGYFRMVQRRPGGVHQLVVGRAERRSLIGLCAPQGVSWHLGGPQL